MTNERTVIVVGAGATYAEADHQLPRPAVLPPLDGTFFDVCSKLPAQSNKKQRGQQTMQDKLGTISKYTTRVQNFDPFRGGWGMEEVFNHIFSDAFSTNPPHASREAYDALLSAYITAIAHTTNRVQPTSSYGVSALLRGLVPQARREIVFVTFNQDLMIEKSIEFVASLPGYPGIQWNIRCCYGHPFHDSRIRRYTKPQPFKDSGPASLRVFKLHGSLNWMYKVADRTKPSSAEPPPPEKLYLINHQKIWPRAKLRGSDLLPIVLPPVYDKSQYFADFLAPIWQQGEDCLREATTVIVFGYCFPDADMNARGLFRRSLARSSALREIVVINPDTAVVAKVARLVSNVPIRYCEDVPEFLSAKS